MARKSDLIAVIDSGVGGISVLRELVKQMPNERFLYYGDSANAPYGSKSTELVRELTEKTVQMLLRRGIKALVVACNTATAAAIDILRETYPEMIIVGIEPALKPAVQAFPDGCVGLMATEVTLREDKLKKLIARYPHKALERIPAPGLVELVEVGKADSPEMDSFLQQLLAPYIGKLDALVLGCTHYPFAAASLRRVLGEKTVLFDGGAGTAGQTRRRLEQAGLLYDGPGQVILENSSNDKRILSLCEHLLTEVNYG